MILPVRKGAAMALRPAILFRLSTLAAVSLSSVSFADGTCLSPPPHYARDVGLECLVCNLASQCGQIRVKGAPNVCHNAACPYGVDTCKQGYVWREGISNDHVCVTPDERDRAKQDNAAEAAHRDPVTAPGTNVHMLGRYRCKPGYVPRLISGNDTVCVTPARRARVQQDNAAATSRRLLPPVFR